MYEMYTILIFSDGYIIINFRSIVNGIQNTRLVKCTIQHLVLFILIIIFKQQYIVFFPVTTFLFSIDNISIPKEKSLVNTKDKTFSKNISLKGCDKIYQNFLGGV